MYETRAIEILVSWFDNLSFDQMTLVLIATELAMGAIIGLISKLIARMRVASDHRLQVIPTRVYESLEFGRDFPRHSFDLFSRPTEFVVVESVEGAVTRERFYTVLGSFLEVIYKDGQCIGTQYFWHGSPLYVCLIVFPCIVGFLGSISMPNYGKILNPLLCSGVLWVTLTFFSEFASNYRRRS